jgi:group I intron endonuclease
MRPRMLGGGRDHAQPAGGYAMIVYLAVNKVNQKAYVGQTAHDLTGRLASHAIKGRHAYASHFQRAVNKYGLDSFDVAILEQCSNKLELNDAERRWIQYFGSVVPVGYNVGSGGEGSLGALRTQAWRDSVTCLAYRQKKSNIARRWRASQTLEQKQIHQANISAARIGKSSPKFHGDGNPAKLPENRLRISEGLRRSWQNPEVRKRRAAAQKRGQQ